MCGPESALLLLSAETCGIMFLANRFVQVIHLTHIGISFFDSYCDLPHNENSKMESVKLLVNSVRIHASVLLCTNFTAVIFPPLNSLSLIITIFQYEMLITALIAMVSHSQHPQNMKYCK